MWLIAFVTESASVKSVLLYLGLSAEAPSVAPARGPPLGDIDPSPAFDLTDPAPVPEDEFDQTLSW